MTTPPRQFFTDFVRRSYEEFRANPADEYHAKNAVTHANVMAARMLHHYLGTPRAYGVTTEGGYRNAIIARECRDFGLVRDVAEGFKHVTLARRSRRVSNYNQTGAKPVQWTTDAGKEMKWTTDAGEEAQWRTAVLVELDDGTTRPLLPILEAVVSMWDRLSTP